MTTPARARAREVDAIVCEIAAAMVAGTWRPGGDTARELAEREGVAIKTVDEWASDAGRLLRVGPDVERVRGVNLARLDALACSADGKVAVAAIAESNRMLGLHAPTRVDVTVQAFAALDDRALLSKVEAQIAELTELRERLLNRMAITTEAHDGDRHGEGTGEAGATDPDGEREGG